MFVGTALRFTTATQWVFDITQLCRWGNWGKERSNLGRLPTSTSQPSWLCYLPNPRTWLVISIHPPHPWGGGPQLHAEKCKVSKGTWHWLILTPVLLFFPVGKPIPVQKKYRPSEEEVDEVHQKYLNELCKLFEEHKAKYNIPEDRHLEFI